MCANNIYAFCKLQTTLSQEEVSKDEEHQKTRQVSSLKEEHKAATATTYSNRAIYKSILEWILVFWNLVGQ
jgi:hypothetical protein